MPLRRRRMVCVLMLACVLAGGAAVAGTLLDPGLKALKAGKSEAAVKAFSEVIASKATPAGDLARAYYYRGLAYSKAGKPAQTIADLTNALWLKGLSDEERQAALTTRAAAYELSGFKARAQADLAEAARLSGGAATASAQPTAEPEAATPVAAGTKAAKTAVSSWRTEAAGTSGEAAPQLSAVPTDDGAVATQSSGGIGGFFSGLFSGSSSGASDGDAASAATSPRRDETSGSVRKGARTRDSGDAAATAAASAGESSAASSWSDPDVSVTASGGKAAAPKVAANTPAQGSDSGAWQPSVSEAPAARAAGSTGPTAGGGSIGGFFQSIFGGSNGGSAPAATGSLGGTSATPASPEGEALPWAGTSAATPTAAFRVQVASVRSADEAKAIASSLESRHAPLLASNGVAPSIAPQAIGAMGTFYQVTVGPFPSERASLKACNELRRAGFDCFIVE